MSDFREVNVDELRNLFSERALADDTMLLSMGPQHPATHGVLRLLLELDGEVVVGCVPDIGYLHTGMEKNMEAKTYIKAEVMTDRMDYLNPIGNNLVYSLAVEKLCNLDVPERAQVIRVILAELQRISSHLLWLGSTCLDLGAMSVFLYAMREREQVLDIFELCSGQRMMTTYIRPGGIWRDVPANFVETVQNFLDILPGRIDQYKSLVHKNDLFHQRTKKIGVIKHEEAVKWGITGPILRGSGLAYDVRKARPYSGYENFEFDIPYREDGDVFARYEVRMDEMVQSARIVKQGLEMLKPGPVRSSNYKFVPPPRSEIGVSMEALIHHFKFWTEGFVPPVGSVFVSTESPRGELGVYLESNGTSKPHRVHYRTPSFAALQIMPLLSKGHFIADLVSIIASIDIILGDSDR